MKFKIGDKVKLRDAPWRTVKNGEYKVIFLHSLYVFVVDEFGNKSFHKPENLELINEI